MTIHVRCWSIFASLCFACASQAQDLRKVVIAHRGASAYLPEHTLPAVAAAHSMGADFIEPDVVLSKDGVPVVLHDIHLDTTTDVRKKFPTRGRKDAHWYAIDFTLSELKSLRVHERTNLKTLRVVYPKRFPVELNIFEIPTLEEEILTVQGLNQSTRRNVGLYPELKSPAFHKAAGFDIAKIVLTLLKRYGYDQSDSNLYLQCFDPQTLRYIRKDLGSSLKLVQLIGENDWGEGDTDFKPMLTENGIKEIAKYATGIGPWIKHVLLPDSKAAEGVKASPLVAWAHSQKLAVHPYTVRADDLPTGIKSFDLLMHLLFNVAGVDGVFTDFPDKAVDFAKRR